MLIFNGYLLMMKLSFLAKVAFICNVCFLLIFLLERMPPGLNSNVLSTLIIIGFPLSMVVNVILHTWLVILLIQHKKPLILVDRWLIVANLLVWIFQLTLLFFA